MNEKMNLEDKKKWFIRGYISGLHHSPIRTDEPQILKEEAENYWNLFLENYWNLFLEKPICPECENRSGVTIQNGKWFCGDCNFTIEDDE